MIKIFQVALPPACWAAFELRCLIIWTQVEVLGSITDSMPSTFCSFVIWIVCIILKPSLKCLTHWLKVPKHYFLAFTAVGWLSHFFLLIQIACFLFSQSWTFTLVCFNELWLDPRFLHSLRSCLIPQLLRKPDNGEISPLPQVGGEKWLYWIFFLLEVQRSLLHLLFCRLDHLDFNFIVLKPVVFIWS